MEAPQSIEAVGNTIEEAIARGLEALNVERREVDIIVLSTDQDRRARVRLTLRARAERAEQAAVASWVPDETTVEAATSDDSAVVLRILTTLLDKMKMPAQIETLAPDALNGYEQGDGPTLAVNLRGLDLSNLIGRRGETLDSLQYLIRMLAAKELARYVNVVIDVEGYKAHRVQILQQLARRTAERVTTTHKPAALEPMPSNERRIVHLTLRDHPHVRTESVGNGENRKVTIIPRSYKR